MSEYDQPFDLDPDLARLPRAQQGQALDQEIPQLPPTAFVASINGQGGNITFSGGSVPAGWTVGFTFSPGAGVINISGPGTMSTKNVAAAIADITTADATDLATAITLANANKAKINEILNSLRTATHINT